MNIALVCPYDLGLPGGVQDQVVKLSGWLRDLGNETLILGPGTEGPDGAVLLGSARIVKANAASTPISFNPRMRARIVEAVAGVDVVHIHEPLMPTVSLSAARITDLPTVGTFHADPPRWARASYSALSPIVSRVLTHLDIITTVSPVSLSAVVHLGDVRVIPNGIDLERYSGPDKVHGRVVFLGRDDPRKGLDTLVEAWEIVRRRCPAATLHVVGADRKITIPGITFLGRVTEAVKQQELAKAEVFVAPNLGGESFGIVVAEGMAAGAAVVASGIPAFLHVLGGAGEIVAPGDAAGLGDRIADVLRDDERRGTLSKASKERVRRFSSHVVADRYLKAYADAIAHHRT
ncbi:MAG: glycosyltransferase family 4 protein [Actinomycetia bacterium]|nr:glycosyltransferase family 4 protein [Actinomycetes bacterium]